MYSEEIGLTHEAAAGIVSTDHDPDGEDACGGWVVVNQVWCGAEGIRNEVIGHHESEKAALDEAHRLGLVLKDYERLLVFPG